MLGFGTVISYFVKTQSYKRKTWFLMRKSISLSENRWNIYEFIQYFNHFYYFLIYPNFYLFFHFLSGGGIFFTHPGNGFFERWGGITPLPPSNRALVIMHQCEHIWRITHIVYLLITYFVLRIQRKIIDKSIKLN